MMQESVYTKLVINGTTSSIVKQAVRNNIPKSGLIEMLEVTEKQFGEIDYLLGKGQTTIVDSDARLIEI